MPGLKLGITGFPLLYTKSPGIHRGFLKASRRRGSYEVLPFDPKSGKPRFHRFLDALLADGYRGINVTIPLKEWAYDYCVRRGAGTTSGFEGRCARLVKAANTIVFSKTGSRAANTDSLGLWDELASWLGKPVLRGARLVVVGTGGAARGAIAGILASHPATRELGSVRVWGRNPAKARALSRMLGRRTRRSASDGRAVIVLWCLPPVSAREARRVWSALAPELADRRVWLYDLNYAERAETTADLVSASRRRSGLGMLRRQARASFDLWRRDGR